MAWEWYFSDIEIQLDRRVGARKDYFVDKFPQQTVFVSFGNGRIAERCRDVLVLVSELLAELVEVYRSLCMTVRELLYMLVYGGAAVLVFLKRIYLSFSSALLMNVGI